ncbi:MAG: DUF222 domain-containing protein, partial [Nocardioides sp.]
MLRQPVVLESIAAVTGALDEAAGFGVEFMSASHRAAALLEVTAAGSRLEALRLRLIAASADVAADDGCRDVAAWLATRTHADRTAVAHDQRLAYSLDRTWRQVARALAVAAVNPAQAEAIVAGLEKLPGDLPTDVLQKAEAHLVEAAATFGPRELRILARRVLDVIAPELGEEHERKALEREEPHARRTTRLCTRRLGDGTTELYARLPDPIAARLRTYLHAFTSPR